MVPRRVGRAPSTSVWKMDMIVLLLLYPIVFLWGVVVGTPMLANKLNMPFPSPCSSATSSASA